MVLCIHKDVLEVNCMTAGERIERAKLTLSRYEQLEAGDQRYVDGWVDHAVLENQRDDPDDRKTA